MGIRAATPRWVRFAFSRIRCTSLHIHCTFLHIVAHPTGLVLVAVAVGTLWVVAVRLHIPAHRRTSGGRRWVRFAFSRAFAWAWCIWVHPPPRARDAMVQTGAFGCMGMVHSGASDGETR